MTAATPDLENSGTVVTESPSGPESFSDEAAALLVDSAQEATVIGADLGRLPDDEFAGVFQPVVEQVRSAAAELPAENRVYVIGLETADLPSAGGIDISEGAVPDVIEKARLLFAYSGHESDDGGQFAHLTSSLTDVDYLLLALGDNGRLTGTDTTIEELRREVVATQTHRITALSPDVGSVSGEEARRLYQQQFRYVFAAALYGYETVENDSVS